MEDNSVDDGPRFQASIKAFAQRGQPQKQIAPNRKDRYKLVSPVNNQPRDSSGEKKTPKESDSDDSQATTKTGP